MPRQSSYSTFSPTTPWASSFLFLSSLRAAKMKSKASSFLKQVISLLASIVKAKSSALKSKTSAFKTRLIIFGLLHNRKVLMSAISGEIHELMGQEKGDGAATDDDDDDKDNKMIVQYNVAANEALAECTNKVESGQGDGVEEDGEEGYPDLRHSLFHDEDGEVGDDGIGSVIDLVKNCRRDGQGEFVLEEEIDHVAELFIKRFYRQMRMQRLESFKRYEEMLERSV